MPSIRSYREHLRAAAELLKAAAGRDVIISNDDLAKLLQTLAGTPMQDFATALYQLALAQEPAGNVRVTKSDIDKIVRLAEDKILGEFDLPSLPLSPAEAARLQEQNAAFLPLATLWKQQVKEQEEEKLSAEVLAAELAELVKGLLFHKFYPEQANIQVYTLAPVLADLNLDAFVNALGDPNNTQEVLEQWERLGNSYIEEPVANFLQQFPVVQKPENQARGAAVVHLLQTQLHDLQYYRFNSDYYENSTYYVAGLSSEQKVVVLVQTDFWN